MHVRIIASFLSIVLLSSAGLPETGPLPAKKPTTTEKENQPDKSETKEKEEPVPPKDAKEVPENKDTKPLTAKPEIKPEPEPVLTIEPEDGKEYAACLAELKRIGATFREEKRIDDGKGCGIDKPLTLEMVLPGIALKPQGQMRCETALELARWTKDAVLPAAKAALESEGPLTAINQASSYVCRLRNNATTGKISEHARGNAIDIASFTFKSGKSIEIQPRDEDSTLAGAFQRAVTATGCLYFETVLDPGSDEAHENHLHFDVLERRNGYRYCR
ncbi:extensin family protein [Pararhizobium sp. BT-229]|uniref:extensin family protein n=1 Tax=Pararhizobium sp. BT-229 TaxID=2986923 RepID=UPI0021F768D1|nr:extensin family protein [Pararhizobium sp. BT-229]MCV9961347.1 extensin family protein [Pararhizobium sp. BT-229]